MNRMFFVIGLILCLNSCGLRESSKSERTAKTEEVSALVEGWQRQIIKSCNASDIAGARQDAEASFGLDLGLVLEKFGRTSVFQDEAGRTIEMTSASGSFGSGSSRFESEVNINGNRRQIAIRTEYAGDECSVYSGDQLLAQAHIAQRAEFRVLFNPALASEARVLKAANLSIARTEDLFFVGARQLLGLADVFRSAEDFPVESIAKILGISTDSAAQYIFAAETAEFYGAVASIRGAGGLTSFSSQYPEIFSKDEGQLKQLLDNREFELNFKMASSSFGVNYSLNPNDQPLLDLTYRLKLEAQPDALPNLRLVAFENSDRVERSGEIFKDCVLKRHEVLNFALAGNFEERVPHYDRVVGSCDALSAEPSRDLFEQKQLREMILKRFEFVTPSRRSYQGWEIPLRQLVMHCARNHSAVQSCLDSNAGGAVIGAVDSYFEFLKSRLPQSTELVSGQVSLPAVLAFNWAITGQSVADERAEQIGRAVSNLSPELSAALPAFVDKIAQHALRHDDLIEFAMSRDQSYKDLFTRLSEVASAAGLYDAVEGKWLRPAIIEKIEAERFIQAEQSIQAIVRFRQVESGRVSDEEFGQERALAQIENTALTELWDDQSFETATKIAELSQFKLICRDKKSVSLKIDCLGLGAFSNQSGKMLNPAYGGRYGELAGDFRDYREKLEKEFDALRFALDDAFGSKPVWSKCDQENFDKNRSELKTAMQTYFSIESYRRFSERDKIEKLLDRCS